MHRPPEPAFNPDACHRHDRELLIHELLAMSRAQSWAEAKLEWDFFDAYEDTNMTHCLCRHGIMERCVLRNRLTGCLALVGNKCVKQFIPHISLDAPTGAIFASIKRVRKDPDRVVHKHRLKMAKRKETHHSLG